MARRTGLTFSQRSRQKSSAEKAAYHHVTGAGRSRVKRPFFDLNREDEDAILARMDVALTRKLSQQG